MQASNPPFTKIHDPSLHEGITKHENLYEILKVYLSLCTILCAGVNIGPMGQA